VLDLGCGVGEHIAILQDEHSFQVTGMDKDPGVIAEGKKRHPGLDLILGDLSRPPEGLWEVLLCLGNSLSSLSSGSDWKHIFSKWRASTGLGGRCRIQWMVPARLPVEHRMVKSQGIKTLVTILKREGETCQLTSSVYAEGIQGPELEEEHVEELLCLEPEQVIDGLFEAGWREIRQLPGEQTNYAKTYIIEATNRRAT